MRDSRPRDTRPDLHDIRRKTEEHINSFPNYKITIDDKVGKLDVHFAALFSTAPDAVPVVLLHGWPGSFLEFLPMLGELRDKYSADDLKYHFIVPSLPGYTLSSAQAISEDFSQIDAARVMDKLMQELGFSKGYIAQGGDVGSRVARVMAVEYEACKAVHRKSRLLLLIIHPFPHSDTNSELLSRQQTPRES